MTPRYSAENDDEIVRLYRAGRTVREIAEQFGVSVEPIRRVLKEQQVPPRKGGKRSHWTNSPEQIEQVASLYRAGESIATLAHRFACRDTSIRAVLAEAGVEIRPYGVAARRLTPADAAALAAEYLKGATLESLARVYEVSPMTVRAYLLREGIDPRPPGHSSFWTDERKADARARYGRGESQQQIANAFGVSQTNVAAMLRHLDVPIRKPRPRRENHGSWRGGRYVDSSGYYRVKPSAQDEQFVRVPKTGYVAEHRLVMGRVLGRPLVRVETVHHINGDRLDNRPENLQLRRGNHGVGVAHKCLDCGSFNISAVPIEEVRME